MIRKKRAIYFIYKKYELDDILPSVVYYKELGRMEKNIQGSILSTTKKALNINVGMFTMHEQKYTYIKIYLYCTLQESIDCALRDR